MIIVSVSYDAVFQDGLHGDENYLDEFQNKDKVNCMDNMEEEYL